GRRWPRHAGDRLGGLAGLGFKRLESTYRKDRVYSARHPARRRRVRRPLRHPARPGPSDDRGRCPICAIPEEADSRAGLSSAFSLRYRQGLARSRTPSTTRWLPPDPLIAAPARLRPPAGQPSGRIDRYGARGSRSLAGRKRPHSCPSERRSEEHTSELQSRGHLVCRLLLEKKKTKLNQK